MYCAEFMLEQGEVEGAIVGLMRSDFDISGATTGAPPGAVPLVCHCAIFYVAGYPNLFVAAGGSFPTDSMDSMGWGFGLSDGTLWHRGRRGHEWVSSSHWASDPHLMSRSALGGQARDRIRLTLDLRDNGILSVHKNDMRLGVLARGLLDVVGDDCGFCWMVQLSSVGQGVRIRHPRRTDVGTSSAPTRGGVGNRSNASWHAANSRGEQSRQLPYRPS